MKWIGIALLVLVALPLVVVIAINAFDERLDPQAASAGAAYARACVAESDVSQYVYRLHDLDAYNRLIGLWVEMIAADVNAEGAADFSAKADVRFYDPHTQKPMRWDAEKKRGYFEARGNFAKRRTDGVDNGRVFITP